METLAGGWRNEVSLANAPNFWTELPGTFRLILMHVVEQLCPEQFLQFL